MDDLAVTFSPHIHLDGFRNPLRLNERDGFFAQKHFFSVSFVLSNPFAAFWLSRPNSYNVCLAS